MARWDDDRLRAVPAGSPDSDVYLMRATGADQRDLTNSPAPDLMPGSWSPDGTRIAFSVFQDGIYVINADGSGRRRLHQQRDVQLRR